MLINRKAKAAFDFFKQRAGELDAQAILNNGKLSKQQLWCREYYEHPYLLLESNQTILDRFSYIFTNCFDLSVDGKITPTPMMESDARLARFFTEIIEETNWRGILNKSTIAIATAQLNAYFRDGTPLGVEMFRDLPIHKEGHLYKFSKKEFVYEMLKAGRFRISPASHYSKGSHLRAIKDLETEKNYRIKAIKEIVEGVTSVEIRGQKLDIINGVVPIDFVVEDYFLFSSCGVLSRRMPTDFEADAVLIIKDKAEFLKRLELELLVSFPGWQFLEQDVYYYDTYNDLPTDENQEFYKHISYAYQKEHRCIVRPRYTGHQKEKLGAFYVELGPLNDIAEVIV